MSDSFSHPDRAGDGQERIATDEKLIVHVCEKGHLDDHHMSIEGCDERCSRCGGATEAMTLAELVRDRQERGVAVRQRVARMSVAGREAAQRAGDAADKLRAIFPTQKDSGDG